MEAEEEEAQEVHGRKGTVGRGPLWLAERPNHRLRLLSAEEQRRPFGRGRGVELAMGEVVDHHVPKHVRHRHGLHAPRRRHHPEVGGHEGDPKGGARGVGRPPLALQQRESLAGEGGGGEGGGGEGGSSGGKGRRERRGTREARHTSPRVWPCIVPTHAKKAGMYSEPQWRLSTTAQPRACCGDAVERSALEAAMRVATAETTGE